MRIEMTRAMLLQSSRSVGQDRSGPKYQWASALRLPRRLRHDVNDWVFLQGFFGRENSFMEMTRKMMHVCENYGNWFIYIRTTFNPVVFVESQRGN
jgi:hypothetical protein